MSHSKVILKFGKHKGEYVGDVPASYLLWLLDQNWIATFPDIVEYIEKNRTALDKEAVNEKDESYYG